MEYPDSDMLDAQTLRIKEAPGAFFKRGGPYSVSNKVKNNVSSSL